MRKTRREVTRKMQRPLSCRGQPPARERFRSAGCDKMSSPKCGQPALATLVASTPATTAITSAGPLSDYGYDLGKEIAPVHGSFQKRQPRISRLSFGKNAVGRYLELLDHPHVHEPPQVIIEAARIANGVAKLE